MKRTILMTLTTVVSLTGFALAEPAKTETVVTQDAGTYLLAMGRRRSADSMDDGSATGTAPADSNVGGSADPGVGSTGGYGSGTDNSGVAPDTDSMNTSPTAPNNDAGTPGAPDVSGSGTTGAPTGSGMSGSDSSGSGAGSAQ